MKLVCVGRLLRMSGKFLLLPVWRSVGKGELDVLRRAHWQRGFECLGG